MPPKGLKNAGGGGVKSGKTTTRPKAQGSDKFKSNEAVKVRRSKAKSSSSTSSTSSPSPSSPDKGCPSNQNPCLRSKDWKSNMSLVHHGEAPLSIDFTTLESMRIPENWSLQSHVNYFRESIMHFDFVQLSE